MQLPAAQPRVLEDNHFKTDRSGNLTEAQLREILDAPVFLEEETRLGIVPVATAYEVDNELPVSSIPHSLSDAIEGTGFFEVTTEVSTDWPKDRSVAGLRELAARYRVKYLLLYRHRFEDARRLNPWGWSYLTVIGAFVAPARTFEAAGVMEATLFDVRTGTILFTVYERVHGQTRMNVWHNDVKRRDLKAQLLEEGAGLLADQVTAKIRRLVAANPAHDKDAPAPDERARGEHVLMHQ